MTIEIIRKANKAMMEGKSSETYNLPKKVKNNIAKTKYTREQLNAAYAKALKME